ncbi:type III secretion system HrpP C-terminal domain-containing protein [Vibrio tritonius]|uniref:Type III secretion system HrpP C-terminal domain-containing protein n=1 Tax=Vibrio tritonius TaxID=1435069 RepID=A0ABS7YPZ7_9VIBR|nr:type III secretion system HrpP C-terminal domain-containing protein [Vibrio tritonius]MCA2016956.1 type III secretion system HrpP C-terminal domain-containing protein [Vibrio tritonius]
MSTLAPIKESLPPPKGQEEDTSTWHSSLGTNPNSSPLPQLQDIGLFTSLITNQSQETATTDLGANPTRWLENITLRVTDCLPTQPQDFHCQLLLPNLGEVQLQAQYQASTWQIQLSFRRHQSAQAVRKEHGQLSDHFSRALQAPVVLSIHSLEGEHDA